MEIIMWALVPFRQVRSRSFSPYQIVKRSLRTISSNTPVWWVCVCAYSQIKNCQTSMAGVSEGTMESWSHTSSCNIQISTNNQFHLAVYHNFQRFQTVLCLCGEDFCSPIFPSATSNAKDHGNRSKVKSVTKPKGPRWRQKKMAAVPQDIISKGAF